MDPLTTGLFPISPGISEPRRLSVAGEITPEAKDSITLASSSDTDSVPDKKKLTLTILHTNDMHGYVKPYRIEESEHPERDIGGLSQLASAVREEREKNPGATLLVDAGDISTGTPYSDLYRAEPMLMAMDAMGYDAMTLGNHEFDHGAQGIRDFVNKAQFPVIVSNMTDETGGVDSVPVKPYIFKEINGLKVGILGLTREKAEAILNPQDRKEIELLDTVTTAAKLVPQMRAEGADLVIAVTHQGIDDDKLLAEQVPGIDVIVGAHTHTALDSYEKIGDTFIVQTGAYQQNLGRIDLDITRKSSGRVKLNGAKSCLIPVNSATTVKDPEVEGIIKPYIDKLAPYLNRVAGQVVTDLVAGDHDTCKTSTNQREFITDTVKQQTGADVVLLNTNSFYKDIKAGDVKVEDIHFTCAWDDGLSVVKMKGKDIKACIESGLKKEALGVAPSGVRIKYDLKRPKGDRIIDLKTTDGEPLGMEKEYTVATRNAMLDASEKYMEYKNHTDRVPVKKSIQEILIERFEAGPVIYHTDGRLHNVTN